MSATKINQRPHWQNLSPEGQTQKRGGLRKGLVIWVLVPFTAAWIFHGLLNAASREQTCIRANADYSSIRSALRNDPGNQNLTAALPKAAAAAARMCRTENAQP